jgi:hypothetical protein
VSAPAGWPADVPPPDAPEWERRAVGWLLDLCPADFRAYEVLRKHPTVLARFAAEHLDACRLGAEHGLATTRHDLRAMGPAVVDDVIGTYERELARVAKARREVELVGRALAGQRFAPRLDQA